MGDISTPLPEEDLSQGIQHSEDFLPSEEESSSDASGQQRSYESNNDEVLIFVNRRDEAGKSGWFASSLLIVNAALGAGLLNYPQAFDEAGGVFVANSVQLLLMLFIVPALVALAYTSDLNNANTLQEVLSHGWGKTGKVLTSVSVALYCYGTSITFLIIIGDQFDRVFASIYGSDFCHFWYMNRDYTMTITSVILIFPFSFSKRIDFLKHISSVGVIAVLYVVFLIIMEYFKGNYTPGPIKSSPDEWTDLFLVVPTILFSYQCHVSVIPIYSCMEKRNIKYFLLSTTLAISICLFTYSVAATFGYLTFGGNVQSDILESYDAKDPWVLIGIVAIALKTYTTYPILLFCGREALSTIWVEASLYLRKNPVSEIYRRISIVYIWFSSSVILAILCPSISTIIKLIGSLAAVFIFIFPGLCLLKIGTEQNNHQILFISLAGLFLIFGTFVFGVVLTQGIMLIINPMKQAQIPLCLP